MSAPPPPPPIVDILAPLNIPSVTTRYMNSHHKTEQLKSDSEQLKSDFNLKISNINLSFSSY